MTAQPMILRSQILLICLLLTLVACDNQPPAITNCEAVNNLTPFCQFHNPEDIETLPDNQTLLISQMGNMEGTQSGSLVFFDPASELLLPAYPPALPETSGSEMHPDFENWGESDCTAPVWADFAPHGISLKQRHDGRWQVAAINHGGRESVEMFELLQQQQQYSLNWRGCVLPAQQQAINQQNLEDVFMNDVALLANGGFIASHMFAKHAVSLFGINKGLLKAVIGMDTGFVFEWQPEPFPQQETSFRILAESHGPFINGVELSADEQWVFANVYSAGEIRKLERQTGKVLQTIKPGSADNLSWDKHGNLLAVIHSAPTLHQKHCMEHPGENCGFEFTLLRINPQTMASEIVLQHQGPPLGAATVARHLGDYLYLGTFSGDRVMQMPYATQNHH